MKSKLLLALVSITLAGTAAAQAEWMGLPPLYVTMAPAGTAAARVKPEDAIKAANAIQAIANSGMGALNLPGTHKGTGWEKTRVRPGFFTNRDWVNKAAMAFTKEANEMAKVAGAGHPAATKEQLGKLSAPCKGCHDDFRIKD